MPHEKINHPNPSDKQLVIAWSNGWAQVSIYPEGWSHTGEAFTVDLPANELDLLISTLKKARRKAYANGYRHGSFADTEVTETSPLFTG